MVITIIKRYDINGSWTHDVEAKLGEFTPEPNSMWRVDEILDIKEMRDYAESLEAECEDLSEKNRLLELRIKEN